MPPEKGIPIHDFAKDGRDSVPFKFIKLGELTSYDFSRLHRHNYYEIFFFDIGNGTHHIDFDEHEIKDNSIHFVSPGQVHLIKRGPSSKGGLILFSRDFFYVGSSEPHSLFNYPFLNHSGAPVLNLAKHDYAGFADILRQIETVSEGDNDINTGILRSYLNIILLKCHQLFNAGNPGYGIKESTVFNNFRQYVENDYRRNRLPSYYADKLNITEKKLNELTKAYSGESAGEFIRQRVLLEAKRLLYNSDHSIKEIAYFLGFDDPSYFNRYFKQNTGLTAGDYRKEGN